MTRKVITCPFCGEEDVPVVKGTHFAKKKSIEKLEERLRLQEAEEPFFRKRKTVGGRGDVEKIRAEKPEEEEAPVCVLDLQEEHSASSSLALSRTSS